MGDHKNTIIAIVLSLIVVVGWQYFVGYPQMEKQRREALLKQQEQSEQQDQQPAQQSTNPAPQTGGAPTVPTAPGAAAQPGAPARDTVVEATPHVAIATPRL